MSVELSFLFCGFTSSPNGELFNYFTQISCMNSREVVIMMDWVYCFVRISTPVPVYMQIAKSLILD